MGSSRSVLPVVGCGRSWLAGRRGGAAGRGVRRSGRLGGAGRAGRASRVPDVRQEVYERVVPLDAIEQVYGHEPLTEGLIRAVDPAADTAVALATARAVGYPVAE
jgi:hypothetical protein